MKLLSVAVLILLTGTAAGATDGRPRKATLMPVFEPMRLTNGEITPLTNPN